MTDEAKDRQALQNVRDLLDMYGMRAGYTGWIDGQGVYAKGEAGIIMMLLLAEKELSMRLLAGKEPGMLLRREDIETCDGDINKTAELLAENVSCGRKRRLKEAADRLDRDIKQRTVERKLAEWRSKEHEPVTEQEKINAAFDKLDEIIKARHLRADSNVPYLCGGSIVYEFQPKDALEKRLEETRRREEKVLDIDVRVEHYWLSETSSDEISVKKIAACQSRKEIDALVVKSAIRTLEKYDPKKAVDDLYDNPDCGIEVIYLPKSVEKEAQTYKEYYENARRQLLKESERERIAETTEGLKKLSEKYRMHADIERDFNGVIYTVKGFGEFISCGRIDQQDVDDCKSDAEKDRMLMEHMAGTLENRCLLVKPGPDPEAEERNRQISHRLFSLISTAIRTDLEAEARKEQGLSKESEKHEKSVMDRAFEQLTRELEEM